MWQVFPTLFSSRLRGSWTWARILFSRPKPSYQCLCFVMILSQPFHRKRNVECQISRTSYVLLVTSIDLTKKQRERLESWVGTTGSVEVPIYTYSQTNDNVSPLDSAMRSNPSKHDVVECSELEPNTTKRSYAGHSTQHLPLEREKVWDKQEVVNLDHPLCLFNALLVHYLHMHDVDAVLYPLCKKNCIQNERGW